MMFEFKMFGGFEMGSVDIRIKFGEIVGAFLKGDGSASNEIGCQQDGIGRGLHVGSFGDVEGKKGVGSCNCEVR